MSWYQVELDLVAIEIDPLCDLECSPDSLVIVQSDDHSAKSIRPSGSEHQPSPEKVGVRKLLRCQVKNEHP